MIDLKWLESGGAETYKKNIVARGGDPAVVDQVLNLNQERKKRITEAETRRAEQKRVSQEVGQKKRAGEDASALIAAMQDVVKDIGKLQKDAEEIDLQVNELLLTIPNKLHESVPTGKSEADNKEVRSWGEKPNFSFKPKEHGDLGEALGLLDFERAAKISGSRFAVLRGQLAQLERALINFKLDIHTKDHGYEEMLPPFIVNSKSFVGTGQFPKFKEDVFHLEGTDYHLIPTAEVPVTNFYSDEILSEDDLPQCFVAYTPCFRSEAGSHGKDTKGLIRQHQFNKVELVRFSHPEKSYEQHELLTSHAEKILQALGLHYRTVALCSGDISFGAAKCYDIEVWLPGQNAFREISSCSNFEDFQARRAGIRFRPSGGGKPQYVHTLNGSGLAVGRTLIAILENYQQEDGKISVPGALQSYMGGLKTIG